MPKPTSSPAIDRTVECDALVNDLTDSLRATAETAVPWFLTQMPAGYFHDTEQADQLSHLRAIIAARLS